MQRNPDSDLVFEKLYRRYYRAVVTVFVRRGFSLDEARDLAQTTFVRVYNGMEAYRGEAEWAYLLETANRVGHNEIRYRQAEKRKMEITSPEDDLDHLPRLDEVNPVTGERPASALDEVLAKERTRQMREAMAALSPEDLRYLRLWISGRQYDEIMVAEQVTMDAVKSRLYRAKRKLREKLREKLGHPGLDWPKDDGHERRPRA